MGQKRRLNKALIWIIICILSFILSYFFYFGPSFLRDYGRIDLVEESGLKYNQIEIENKRLNILGADPWILFEDLNTYIYDIKIDYDMIQGSISNLKIYIDTGDGFSERISYQIVDRKRLIINSAAEIKNLRVDFENPSQQPVIQINSISINSPNHKSDLIRTLVFMFFSLTATIYVFLKKLHTRVRSFMTIISNIIFIIFSSVSSKIISLILYTSIGVFLICISALIYIMMLLFLSHLLRKYIGERIYAD